MEEKGNVPTKAKIFCTQPVPPQIRIYYTMVRVSTCNDTKFKSSTLDRAFIK
jgi:hypothetical protein